MRRFRWIGFGLALFYVGYRYLFRQPPLRPLRQAQPAQDYPEAIERLQRIQAAETVAINTICRTQLLTSGHKVAKVIVLLHGFTNCPHQFSQLAAQFHARGYAVLNLRLPYHGLADRLTPDLMRLTMEEILALTNEAVDIAQGLGEEVTLLGFSLGGILAAWAAQHRSDLDCAVLVSPALGLKVLPPLRSRPTANLLALLPNMFVWWDSVQKAAKMDPLHAYPRYATRALAVLIRLGCLVQLEAKQTKPAARSIMLITNPSDQVVDNVVAQAVANQWQQHGAVVHRHEFPQTWNLLHDLMDPTQPEQQVARVYPLLLEWVDSRAYQGATPGENCA